MKAEKILTIATQLNDVLKNNDYITAFRLSAELIEEARAEINAQTARAAGQKGIHAAALRILKSADGFRPALTKANATPAAVTVSDGFRLVQFHANDAPPVPTWTDAPAGSYPNFNEIINGARENKTPATLPTVSALKNFIKTEKATRKASATKFDRRAPILYKLPEGVHVSAAFLLDMLEALPNCSARVTCQEWKRGSAPLYFEAANGCGVLCPCRVSEA